MESILSACKTREKPKSFQANLKQVIEWASVAGEPWDNSEKIALSARDFIEQMQFGDEFIQHINESQPDMQIYKYLRGSTDARTSPIESGNLTAQILTETLKRMSHNSLYNLIRINNLNIDESALDQIKANELQTVDMIKNRLIGYFNIGDTVTDIDDESIAYVKNCIREKTDNHSYGLYSVHAEMCCNLWHTIRGE